MAKIYGLFGTMTGKLADTVMSVRNGEQLARKYQPVVFNPSTPAQVAQRAKMKLLSQLSAVVAPVIAIRREGSISSRNLFTKVNYWLTTYNNNEADITLTDVQLTRSSVGLPGISATREGAVVTVGLISSDVNVDRMVYAAFVKGADNKLSYLDSKVISEAGANGHYDATFDVSVGVSLVIYAYGVRDNSEAARVTFSNLTAPTAELIAKIVTTRTLTETDVTLTETRGANLPAA